MKYVLALLSLTLFLVGLARAEDCPCGPNCQCTPAKTCGCGIIAGSPGWADALDEVNATRAARGLPPFARDEALTLAAAGCAVNRATYLIAGHTANDFTALPAGAHADAAGCAAWPQGMGWGACCTYEQYRTAGAAYAIGRDGKRYMHLFVRRGGPSIIGSTSSPPCPDGKCPNAPKVTTAAIADVQTAEPIMAGPLGRFAPMARVIHVVEVIAHRFGGRFRRR